MNMERYNEKEADNLDRLIHWVLARAAKKTSISCKKKTQTFDKVKKKNR